MVIITKPEFTNEDNKTVRAQLFADTKEEVTAGMTVVGLKEGYTLDVASSVVTPSGIGFLKSNGEWQFMSSSGGSGGGGGESSMQYKILGTVTGSDSKTYAQLLDELGKLIIQENPNNNELAMAKLVMTTPYQTYVFNSCVYAKYDATDNEDAAILMGFGTQMGLNDRSVEVNTRQITMFCTESTEYVSSNKWEEFTIAGNNEAVSAYYNDDSSYTTEDLILSVVTMSES